MRRVGIIGDGETDYRVFKKIVETVLLEKKNSEKEIEVIWLERQTLHDDVDKYWRKNTKEDPIKDLQKAVTGILFTAISDFKAAVSDSVTCKDMMLLTTDAEKHPALLNNEQNYWERDGHYFGILHCVIDAIRNFYTTQYQQGLSPENLPMIIPIITFPSIEPFLLIAKGEKPSNINGRNPNDLKKLLYKTDNPSGEAIEQAIGKIEKDKIYDILKIIPESRFLIQTLLMLK